MKYDYKQLTKDFEHMRELSKGCKGEQPPINMSAIARVFVFLCNDDPMELWETHFNEQLTKDQIK